MKIYLDNCCLNRPFDDLRDDSVRMEAEAVLTIISRSEDGDLEFWTSDVLFDEIINMPDMVRCRKVLLLCEAAGGNIPLTEKIVMRAHILERSGIKPYDALHVASSEAGNIDVFLTTDRRLLSAARRAGVKVKVQNPLIWWMEEQYAQR